MFKKIAAAASLILASSAAFAAQPNTFYAGVDAGKTRTSEWHGSESSYGVFAGYNITPGFAVEAGFRRLGEAEYTGAYRFTADQIALSGVASLPLNERWNLLGRVGINQVEGTLHYRGNETSNSPVKAVIGAGVSYAFYPNVTGRLEFQKIGSDTRNLSFGVARAF